MSYELLYGTSWYLATDRVMIFTKYFVPARYTSSMAVNPNDPRRPRDQIAEALRTDIAGGIYPAGSRLPSIVVLAERFDVSTSTVQAALALLQQETLVYSAGNRGTFVGPAEAAQNGGGELDKRVASLEEQVRSLTARLEAIESGR